MKTIICTLILISNWGATAEEPLRIATEFDKENREYFLRFPQKFDGDETYWLVVTVHGGGGDGRSHWLTKDVDRELRHVGLDAIVLSPSFSNTDKNSSQFPSLGEGAFLLHVLEEVRSKYQIRDRILLTGYSRGGQFTHRFTYQHPDLVAAVATCAAGTWTTPEGQLLIESFGATSNPEAFLLDDTNASKIPGRLSGLFEDRTARVAGNRPANGANRVPFLVMCGSLDTRYDITLTFVKRLMEAGFRVETYYPRTPHGGRSSEEYGDEFLEYSKHIVEFFASIVDDL